MRTGMAGDPNPPPPARLSCDGGRCGPASGPCGRAGTARTRPSGSARARRRRDRSAPRARRRRASRRAAEAVVGGGEGGGSGTAGGRGRAGGGGPRGEVAGGADAGRRRGAHRLWRRRPTDRTAGGRRGRGRLVVALAPGAASPQPVPSPPERQEQDGARGEQQADARDGRRPDVERRPVEHERVVAAGHGHVEREGARGPRADPDLEPGGARGQGRGEHGAVGELELVALELDPDRHLLLGVVRELTGIVALRVVSVMRNSSGSVTAPAMPPSAASTLFR